MCSDFKWLMAFSFRMLFGFIMAAILFKTKWRPFCPNHSKSEQNGGHFVQTIRKPNTIWNTNKMAAILFKTIRNLNIRNQTWKMFGFRMDSEFEWSELEPRLYQTRKFHYSDEPIILRSVIQISTKNSMYYIFRWQGSLSLASVMQILLKLSNVSTVGIWIAN